MRLLLRVLINAIALWVAIQLIDGVEFSGGWGKFLVVAVVFGLVNAFIRPIVKLLTCPLLVLTLGLFTFVLNALMLLITSWLSDAFDLGFVVQGFLPAFWAALIISIVSAILSLVLGGPDSRKD